MAETNNANGIGSAEEETKKTTSEDAGVKPVTVKEEPAEVPRATEPADTAAVTENSTPGNVTVKSEPMDVTEEEKEQVLGQATNGSTEFKANGANEAKPKPESDQDEKSAIDESLIDTAEQLGMENERLERVLLGLCERQTVLEEFIEVEYGPKYDKFLNNRERLVNVMGLQDDKSVLADGKRSSKSHELVGLLKVVKEQAAANSGSSSSTSSSGTSSGNKRPIAQDHQDSSSKKAAKPCVSCFLTDHFADRCPYKGTRNPQIQQQISERRTLYFQSLRGQNRQ